MQILTNPGSAAPPLRALFILITAVCLLIAPGCKTGGGEDGSATLDDGSIGSSCGECNEGLTCYTDAPEGYCSRQCTDSSQCGTGAYCYNTDDYGAVCLQACAGDRDCRNGYTCQGDTGSTVCYPDPGDNAALSGCYSMNNEIFFQLWFDGQSRFQEVCWNSLSGTIVYPGAYRYSNGHLHLDYDDGSYTDKEYEIVIAAEYILLDGTPYYYSGPECS